MKFRTIYFLAGICATLMLAASCTKDPGEGFLGNQFFYLSNPFTGIKGRVTVSVPMQADGSSNPLNVKLLAVRKRDGQLTDALTKLYEIPIYKGEVTPADSTPELLAKKLGTQMYAPFNVNSIGGRLELTPATAFVDTGLYDFDVEVSNVKGAKVINSIAKVVITPSVPSQIVRQFVNTSVPNQEVTFVTRTAAVTTQRIDGPNKIIIKFVDKNNVPFNPKTGQVVPRVSLPTDLRFTYKQFAPYYPEEVTDTAFVYRYPEKIPTFPLFTLNNAYLSSYRIPAQYNDLNLNINPEFSVRFFPTDGIASVSGTWIITNKMTFAAKL